MKILEVNYNDLTVDEALEEIFSLLSKDKKANVFFMNVDCLCKAQKDDEYKEILQNADLVLPDGIGLRLASALFGGKMKDNCNGTDLSPKILERARQGNLKVFFLGGRDGVAQAAAENMRNKYPGIKIAGSLPGYFKDDGEVIDKINRSGADILFVAMGVPLQEKWIYSNRQALNVKVCIGVGAFLDFVSGSFKRAPLWIRNIHFEWLWRAFLEPKRLSKRYLSDAFCLSCYLVYRRLKGDK